MSHDISLILLACCLGQLIISTHSCTKLENPIKSTSFKGKVYSWAGYFGPHSSPLTPLEPLMLNAANEVVQPYKCKQDTFPGKLLKKNGTEIFATDHENFVILHFGCELISVSGVLTLTKTPSAEVIKSIEKAYTDKGMNLKSLFRFC